MYVKELDIFLTMKVLDNTPAVLSLGKFCDENGYSYEWINGQKPHLIKKGIRIPCMQHGEPRSCCGSGGTKGLEKEAMASCMSKIALVSAGILRGAIVAALTRVTSASRMGAVRHELETPHPEWRTRVARSPHLWRVLGQEELFGVRPGASTVVGMGRRGPALSRSRVPENRRRTVSSQ